MVDVSRVVLAVDSRDVKKASRDLDGMDRSGQAASRTTMGLGKALMGLAVASGGIFAIKRGFDAVVAATREQEAAVAQLRQGLVSTGNQVGRSLDELKEKAAQLQLESTFGDEKILVAMSQLVTFTGIAGDQFDRTTQAALDLSTRMGTDLTSSVLQLGKALNDPIANLGALGRAGIQFSDAQTDLIKNLAATNRLAEAQDVILQELETQFGGSAAAARHTLGGALQALQNTFGDMLEADEASSAVSRLTGSINNLNREINDPQLVGGMGGMTEWLLDTGATAIDTASMFLHAGKLFKQMADDLDAQRLIPTTSAVGDLLGQAQGLFSGLVEAARGAGLFREAIDDLADEAVATVKVTQQLTEVTTDVERQWETTIPVAKDLTSEYQEMGRMMDDLVDHHERLADRAQRLIDKLDPNAATVRRLQEEYRLLEWAVRNGEAAFVDLQAWVEQNVLQEVEVQAQRVTAEMVTATEQVEDLADEADPMAKAWETAMERIDTAFADAWTGAFDSFRDFADGLKNAFKQLLAEMAHMAITRPILVSLGLVGGSGSAVAGTGSALSTAASGGNLLSLLGGGIGAMGGNLVGGITGVGSALGVGSQTASVVGGLGSLGNSALGAFGMGGAGAGASFLAGAGIAGIAAFGAYKVIDSLFGSEGNKRAGVGINTGTGSLETFGSGGNLEPAEQIGQALLQFSQAIGGSGSMLEIARGNKSGFELNGERFADAASLVDAALDDILDTAWHLAPVVKDLAKQFDGSLEATAAYATAMQGVWEMANQNPVRMAMRDMESANTSVMQAYRDQVSAISELVQNFDGSAGAAQNLNAALAQNQQFAYQLAVAIGQVSGELDSMFAGSAQSIRESVMSRPDKIEMWKGQRRDLRQDLNDLDDIDAINSTAKEIDRLNSLIFQNLTPEAQKKQAEAFAGFAESTNDQAQNRLDAVLKDIETTQAKQNSDIRNGMLDAAAAQQDAADTMLTAAQQMAAAVAGFSQGGGFEVNV